ncbi:MAG: hypothetical protein L6264_07480 [Weeksellaceae bacterium]|nr:hypothetical protein [Bacteroidota bacterium]MCG2780775.1 hypothetical protein [Weeksellaceae bacterium]
MAYVDDLIEEINNFITEKTRDLCNYDFKEVMMEVSNNIDAQLDALEESEQSED